MLHHVVTWGEVDNCMALYLLPVPVILDLYQNSDYY